MQNRTEDYEGFTISRIIYYHRIKLNTQKTKDSSLVGCDFFRDMLLKFGTVPEIPGRIVPLHW